MIYYVIVCLPLIALMPFIKSFGKDKVVDTLVKGAVSPKNAKAAVDEAIKLESKEYVKKITV